MAEVAKTLGMPKASLGNWVRAQSRGAAASSVDGKASVAVVTPEQAELARLRAEVARLRMERDIAKKAAAYFAQDLLQGTPGSNR
jgi:transposase-like protein